MNFLHGIYLVLKLVNFLILTTLKNVGGSRKLYIWEPTWTKIEETETRHRVTGFSSSDIPCWTEVIHDNNDNDNNVIIPCWNLVTFRARFEKSANWYERKLIIFLVPRSLFVLLFILFDISSSYVLNSFFFVLYSVNILLTLYLKISGHRPGRR